MGVKNVDGSVCYTIGLRKDIRPVLSSHIETVVLLEKNNECSLENVEKLVEN